MNGWRVYGVRGPGFPPPQSLDSVVELHRGRLPLRKVLLLTYITFLFLMIL